MAVVARTTDVTGLGLAPGDVIHAVNASPVIDLDGLRSVLENLDPGDAVVLQVERAGELVFAAFKL